MSTFTKRIAAGADDYRTFNDDTFSSTGNNERIGQRPSNSIDYDSGMRFLAMTIDGADTIDASKITILADTTNSTTGCDVDMFMDDIDDAVAPTDASEHVALNRTTNKNTITDVETWTQGQNFDLDMGTAALQEVIDRGSWASGNDVQLLIDAAAGATEDRKWETFENDSATAPLLTVTFTVGAAADPIPDRVFQVEQAVNRASTY